MINTYTASPSFLSNDKIDMSKIGQGTGTIRFAAGLYFGKPATVAHYLEQYKSTNFGDATITCNGVNVDPSTPAYDIIKYLHQRGERATRESAYEYFKDRPEIEKEAIDFIIGNENINYTAEFGICHEVKLRGVNEEDLLRWEEDSSSEELCLWACKIMDKLQLGVEDIHKLPLEEYGITKSDTLETSLSNIFDVLYEEATEEDLLPGCYDSTPLYSIFIARAFSDDYFSNHYDVHYEQLREAYPIVDMLNEALSPYINVDNTMTYGDFYEQCTNLFKGEENERKLQTSKIFAEVLKVPGFSCLSMQGNQGDREFVVFDEQILQNSSFLPISHQEFGDIVSIEEDERHLSHEYTPRSSYSPRF